jgi:hypothetical protein
MSSARHRIIPYFRRLVIIRLEFKVIGDEGNWGTQNTHFISFDQSVLLDEIDGVGILSSCQIVDPGGPGVVEALFYFIISVYVNGEVGPEIVRDTVSIARRVKESRRAAQVEDSQRQCYGAACAIDDVKREAIAVGQCVVADEVGGMGLIEAGRIELPFIDQLARERIILS